MQRSVFATCPGCQEVLRIPATWADKAVKCKKCGSIVRATGKAVPASANGAGVPNAFDFEEPVSDEPSPFLPAAETPPSIPTPPAYGPPPMQPPAVAPGYPYGPPPGYPYPMPTQSGYAPAPYGYAPPPGYPGAPPGYPAPPPGYPYAPPLGYPGAPPASYAPNPYGYAPQAPPAFAPAPVAITENFADAPKISSKRRYKKGNNTLKLAVMGAFFVFAAGLVVAGILFQDKWGPMVGLKNKPKPTEPDAQGTNPGATPTKPGSGSMANLSAPYPRRMLFISVTKYLYCNTLTGGVNGGPNGNGRSELVEAAKQLAFQFRVPTDKDNNQLFILTDADGKLASGAGRLPMLKDVVLDTAKRFAESSRGQDRVVFYFGGHAAMKDGKAYLVPVEGDLNEPESLLPLDDFFAVVKDCPAQQKVILFDVCRVNTDGNVVRPGSEPMSEDLEKALLAPPAGANIQVITACSAGQNAAELAQSDGEHFAGSAFLNSLRIAAKQAKAGNKSTKPEDPLPVTVWIEATKPILTEYVGTKMPAPIPKLGGELGEAVAYSADEAPAKRFEFPNAPKMIDAGKLKDVFALLDLKPVHLKSDVKVEEESLEMVFPFQAEALVSYKPETIGKEMEEAAKDDKAFPLRSKTVMALDKLRDKWGGKDGSGKFSGVRSTFAGETSNNVKDSIKNEQIPLAEITDDLDELVKDLQPMLAELDKEESKAWKASFLYALAQAKSRLSYLHEANLALGNILTESLPEQLDKANGLQLVSVEKMKSKKEFRKFADEAKELYDTLAKENKGTPWEVLAKRARVESLGLEWKPFMPPKNTDDDDKMEMKKDK